MVGAGGVGREPRIGCQIRHLQHLAETPEQPVVAGGDHDLAVGGAEGLERGDRRMPRSQRSGLDAGRLIPRQGVLQDGHHAVQHGDVHAGTAHPLVVAFAPQQPGQDADHRVQAADDVGDRRADPHGLTRLGAGDGQQAGATLDDHVVGRSVGVGPRIPEAGAGDVHQPLVEGAEPPVVEPQPRQHARAEALDQHVGRPKQIGEYLAPGLVLEVQRDRTLAAVEADEVAGSAAGQERAEPARVVAPRRLDLDDLGAQIAQDHVRERPGEHPRHVDDDDPGQRHAVGRAHPSVVRSNPPRSAGRTLRRGRSPRCRIRDTDASGGGSAQARSPC